MDGIVTNEEAEGFKNWVNVYAPENKGFPFSDVQLRLSRIYEDGHVDDNERAELLELIKSLSGIDPTNPQSEPLSTTLPLCNPAPDIKFQGSTFVITGKCAYGTRAKVGEAILQRGGIIGDNPSRSTNYLLIGFLASRDWIHSTHGLKIQRAIELRQTGSEIAIISEEHWRKHLN
jgi:NAD-dependent DNA ligase